MKYVGYILGGMMMVSSAFAMTNANTRKVAINELIALKKETADTIKSAKVITPDIVIMYQLDDFLARSIKFCEEYPDEVLKELSKEEYAKYEAKEDAFMLELDLLTNVIDKLDAAGKLNEEIKIEQPAETKNTFIDELFPYIKSAVMSEVAMGIVKYVFGSVGNIFSPKAKTPIKVKEHIKLDENQNVVFTAPKISMKGGIPRSLRTFMKVENIKTQAQ